MTTTGRTTAVGVFTERGLAESAIEKLRQAGFSEDQIGFVAREHGNTVDRDMDESAEVPNAASGAIGGGIIGGVIGAVTSLLIPGLGPALAGGILAATLGGAAIGAVAGGFAGSLMHMGVPEGEAHYYQEQLATGRVLVTVNAENRYEEAVNILRQAGAFDAEVRDDMPPTTEPGATMYNADINPGNYPPVMVPPVGYNSGLGAPATYVNPVQPAAGYAPIVPPANSDSNDTTDTAEPAYTSSEAYNTKRTPEELSNQQRTENSQSYSDNQPSQYQSYDKVDEQRDSYPRATENDSVYGKNYTEDESRKETTPSNDYEQMNKVYDNNNYRQTDPIERESAQVGSSQYTQQEQYVQSNAPQYTQGDPYNAQGDQYSTPYTQNEQNSAQQYAQNEQGNARQFAQTPPNNAQQQQYRKEQAERRRDDQTDNDQNTY